MRTRWEYAALELEYTVKNYTAEGVSHVSTLFLSLPGSTRNEAPDLDFYELLAQLGEDGWELVTETMPESVILGGSRGYASVGAPIKYRWLFKRRRA